MKWKCQQELARINGLPDNLVKKILVCLPIEDAVKTSVLSQKWRYAWTEIPKLIFDDTSCERLSMMTKSEFIMVIYQVLLQHRGPLDVFKLCLFDITGCPEIDVIVRVVLKAGVKDFTLYMPNDDKPYELPSSIFAYGQQLEALHLRFCVLTPPTGYNGFSKLVRLELKEVGISGRKFSSLISKCPQLKYLYFISYTNCGSLDIVAPNLEEFSFVGICESPHFKNTPKLSIVQMVTHDNGTEKGAHQELHANSCCATRCPDSCGSLPAVEELTLSHFYLKHLMYRNRSTQYFSKYLCRLKALSLRCMCFGFFDEVFSALRLVKNATNLESLKIEVHSGNTASDVELIRVEGYSDITLESLREFELQQAFGSKCELQFIELILAKSPVMEKCLIIPNSELVGEKGWSFFKELSRFRRASPLVEIAYEG